MKAKKIFIQMGVTVDLDNEDLIDFLAYLPERLTGFVTHEDAILEDELCDEDIKILDENGKTMSVNDGFGLGYRKLETEEDLKGQSCLTKERSEVDEHPIWIKDLDTALHKAINGIIKVIVEKEPH